jgi:uncharacterized protein YjeT (DUF2065 family)
MPEWVWAGLAFALVLEGAMPLLTPRRWRQVFAEAVKLADGQIRFLGAASACTGLVLLFVLGT